MRKKLTLILITVSFLITAQFGHAQNLLRGGGCSTADASSWTVGWRSGTADDGSIEFGIAENLPSAAVSATAAKITFGSGGWTERQLWQAVTLEAGKNYRLSAMINTQFDHANMWVQGFIMNKVDYDLTGNKGDNAFTDGIIKANATQLLQIHPWTGSETPINIDGTFPSNGDGLSPVFTAETSGDYIVLFKFGGGAGPVELVITDISLEEEIVIPDNNLLKGGACSTADASSWTVGWRSGTADDGSIEFGIAENLPSDAVSATAAKITFGSGGWTERQLWQTVSLEAGGIYKLSAMAKAQFDHANMWIQGFLMNKVDFDLTGDKGDNAFSDGVIKANATQLLQIHPWTGSETLIDLDGLFPSNGDGLIPAFVAPEDGEYILLFKFGGGAGPVELIMTDIKLEKVGQDIDDRALIVKGGACLITDSKKWTIGWRSGTADVGSIEFGVTENLPSAAVSSTAAKITFGSGGWTERQLWQVVHLEDNSIYELTAQIAAKFNHANMWVQGYIMPKVNTDLNDATGGSNAFSDDLIKANGTQLLQIHEWTGDETPIDLDGLFPSNGSGLSPEFTIADGGEYILLFKFGGGAGPVELNMTDIVITKTGEVTIAETGPNKLQGGNCAADDEFKWQTGWRGEQNGGFTFGNTANVPSGAESPTALQITFGTNWAENQLWQTVHLSADNTYELSAMVNANFDHSNMWVQGFIMPKTDPDLIDEISGSNAFSDAIVNSTATKLLQVHEWTSDVTPIDINGAFPSNADPAISPQYKAPSDGEYVVLFKFGGGAGPFDIYMTDISLVNLDPTSVQSMKMNDTFLVYPTVAHNVININGIEDAATVSFYTPGGRMVRQEKNVKNCVDVSNLEGGLYLLRIIEGQRVAISRIVVR